jgi:uncharacterized membrane-anchored protein YhcB (DUF1043 family)
MTTFTNDQWIILALVFVLGLLIGMFLTSGGRRKWKTRYRDEVTRREALEREHRDREKHWASREKEWSSRDNSRVTSTRRADTDRDGVPDRADDRPLDDRRS